MRKNVTNLALHSCGYIQSTSKDVISTASSHTDAHHIEHWAHGGETKASNLVTLCKAHHRAVHEGRIRVEHCDSPGALRFVKPDGQAFDSIARNHTRPFSDWTQLPAIHQQHGIYIDKKTAATRWCGESMDFGLAIEVLFQQSRRAQGVSQETRREEAH